MHPPPAFRRMLQGLGLALLLSVVLSLLAAPAARAEGIELASLQVDQREGALVLDFSVRITLSAAVEDALRRGVPVYFAAQADLYRNRWYWRDARIARITRTWRLAYQPLTGSWRVGIGGLNQTFATQAEALAAMSRIANWQLADAAQIDPDKSHYVEFSFRLDTSQLPSPMQISVPGSAEWSLGVEHTVRVP
jgi:Domain of unknown function (DUF4390)